MANHHGNQVQGQFYFVEKQTNYKYSVYKENIATQILILTICSYMDLCICMYICTPLLF